MTQRQLDALTTAGYRLQPHLDDGGAGLLLAAARRAFRAGRLRPADVIGHELAALRAAGYEFVLRESSAVRVCASFMWGPRSFEACDRCGLSFWQHDERGAGADHRTHHRR